MKIHFLLLLLLFYVGLSAQLSIHSAELPVMTRSGIHSVLVNSSGEKLYYFTSRSCATTRFFLEDQSGVEEITTTAPLLVISSAIDHLDNIWVLSDSHGLHVMKMTMQGDVLESWQLPLEALPFSPDPVLIWTDQLELLLDGHIYRLDPFNQLIESVDSPVAFKNIIYHNSGNHLIAYNDTLLCFIDQLGQIVFDAKFPSIQHVFIGPYDEVYQMGRWSIQAVSPDEGIRRLVNFSQPLSNGMVSKVGEQYLLFESPSSLFWESYRIIDMQYGRLEDKVSLTDLGYLVTYPVVVESVFGMYLLGFDQYAYQVLTIGDGPAANNLPDLMIQHASGQIVGWTSDRDGHHLQVIVTVELDNVGDTSIDYFTIACSSGTSSCQEWYYFTDSIPGFKDKMQVTYSFDLHMVIYDLDPDQDSIYLTELCVIAINGMPDKNRMDNQISTFAHFETTTAILDIELPLEAVVYPNPCTDVLFIKSDQQLPFQALNLYDNQGKVVKTLTAQDTPNAISSLPAGSYFLLGEMEDGRRTKPSVVIKK